MRGSRTPSGFTLIELMIVITIMGLLFTFTIPALNAFRQSSDMASSARNIARQLLLAREKAISTGQMQQLRFMANFQGTSDYHVWNGTSQVLSWKLPKNITYNWATGTNNTYRMTPDGRCMDSGLIILTDARGHADTVSVLSSGLVLVY
jgi:type II secretion system protein H